MQGMLTVGNDMTTEADTPPTDSQIEAAALHLLARRGLESSICPSEVARLLKSTNWRALMPRVRDVSRQLALAGRLNVTQRGVVLSPLEVWKGPVRLKLVGTCIAP